MILLSDGGVNRPLLGRKEVKNYAVSQAVAEAKNAAAKGIVIYTISLGESNTDRVLMEEIAEVTGGRHYIAPSPQDLVAIYEALAEKVLQEARGTTGTESSVVPAAFTDDTPSTTSELPLSAATSSLNIPLLLAGLIAGLSAAGAALAYVLRKGHLKFK
jgi:hypothetical protein